MIWLGDRNHWCPRPDPRYPVGWPDMGLLDDYLRKPTSAAPSAKLVRVGVQPKKSARQRQLGEVFNTDGNAPRIADI